MRLTFHGGAGQVTGSNYLLEFADTSMPGGTRKILIDCGLHQGSNFCEKHNYDPFPFDPKEIAEVFVTHAHIDHTGRLPKLIRAGFLGTVYSTPPTKDFAEMLLLDSGHILSQEAERDGLPVIYDDRDIADLMKQWRSVLYHKTIKLGPHGTGAAVTLFSAGHILGSASVLVEAEGKHVLFSGDLGNSPSPLIGPAEAPQRVDSCVMESTYGDRIHEDLTERQHLLQNAITETMRNKGTLMIPVFALERTQILLLEIKDMVEKKKIPRVPIFLDSPLAIGLTTIYNRYRDYFKPEVLARFSSRETIFDFPGLKMTSTTEESKAINYVPSPKIVIAGSGMSQGGRILHHEKRYLPDPRSALLIFGYQSQGSLGRRILDGAQSVRILGEDVSVRAKIKAIGAYSAHADQKQLLEWLMQFKGSVKQVYLVHAEPAAAASLHDKIADQFGIQAIAPSEHQVIEL
ncbi:MAG: MBL fold metallo-hydrolase [bacterium]|nr:MBL fold metallo-hydrolase [bacterium]